MSALLFRAICALGLLDARRLKSAATVIEQLLQQQFAEKRS